MKWCRCILLAMAVLAAPVTAAAEMKPRVAIIIDDIGDRFAEGKGAVTLPGPVACAFLPHTPHAAALADLAHASGKEVLLHLPLQSLNGKALGPGAITLHTTEREFRRILAENLAAIPHVRGVNNHMGSLLTRHPGHMTWLMRVLAERGDLFFVDSYTHPGSVAFKIANEQGIRSARRDVFLDNVPDREAIGRQFRRLVEEAKRNGAAIGIGHPYPETLAFLAEVLPELGEKFGVELVPVESLLSDPPHWVDAKPSQHAAVQVTAGERQ